MLRIDLTKRNIMRFLFACFLLVSIFFPGDPYNIKLLLFAILCFSNVSLLLSCIVKKRYIYIYFMSAVYSVILILWSSIVGGHLSESISGAYCPFLMLLLILAVELKIAYEAQLIGMLEIMMVLTILIIGLDLIGVVNVNGNGLIRQAFYKFDMGLMGKSPNYASFYKVFFKTSPLLIMLIPYSFKKKKYFLALLSFGALIISGTRANIFVAAALMFFNLLSLWREKEKNRGIAVLVSFVTCIALALFVPVMIRTASRMMHTSGSIGSDVVRSGQLQSFFKVLSDPKTLLLGQGFGSQFYDLGRMAYSGASEISYLDLLRKIGLIWFIPFMVFVLRPFAWKIDMGVKIAYFGYLLICLTNPLLFSSTAYVLYIYIYYLKYHEKREKLILGRWLSAAITYRRFPSWIIRWNALLEDACRRGGSRSFRKRSGRRRNNLVTERLDA